MIVVTNPGTHPHLARLAVEFGHRGPVRYLTSASFAHGSVLQRTARSAALRRLPGVGGLRRRVLPDGLRPQDVRRFACAAEARFYIARALGLASSDDFMSARTALFQRRAAAYVRRTAPTIVVAEYTGALEILEAAPPGTLRVLDYPIAHHRWMERELDVEARENPRWAATLQGRGLDPQVVARLDAEIARADLVLVPSRFVARTFVQSGVDAARVAVSNLGADPAVGGHARKAADPSRPLRLLFAGQVTQRKGISYLLDAVAQVPGVELRVLGYQPPGVAELLQGRERVTSAPSVGIAELDAEYERADLLVLPSLAEGFPLVAIGAMSRGTALVLTVSAAAEDLIDDGVEGLRVPSRDAHALALVLAAAERDRDAVVRMGEAAAARAARFTWEAYAVRTADLIERCAANR